MRAALEHHVAEEMLASLATSSSPTRRPTSGPASTRARRASSRPSAPRSSSGWAARARVDAAARAEQLDPVGDRRAPAPRGARRLVPRPRRDAAPAARATSSSATCSARPPPVPRAALRQVRDRRWRAGSSSSASAWRRARSTRRRASRVSSSSRGEARQSRRRRRAITRSASSAAALRQRQRVVAALDGEEARPAGRQRPSTNGASSSGLAEGVARALDEEHRCAHLRQVRRAQLLRLARRVQRIAEQHEARRRRRVRRLAAATWVAMRPPIDLPPMKSRAGGLRSADGARRPPRATSPRARAACPGSAGAPRRRES